MRCIVLLLVCLRSVAALELCPHKSPGLLMWSHNMTWPDLETPSMGAHVDITSEVLLDISPPPLFNIHVKRNGRLVVSPHVRIKLYVTHFIVEGKLEIGSENCPHEGEVDIFLEGRRHDYDIGDGEKGINVMDGGTLELHGKRKLSWTKLAKTLPKAEHLYSSKTEDLTSEEGRWINAILAVTLTTTGYEQFRVRQFGVYRIFSNWIVERKHHMQILFDHFSDASYGDIVMLATQRRTPTFEETGDVLDKLEELAYGKVTGNCTMRNLTDDNVYAAVLQKGIQGSFKESLLILDVTQATTEAKVFINDWTNGLKFTASSIRYSESDFNDGASFAITKTSEAYPIIDVIDDGVSTWEIGDKVILPSTDYDWRQVEEGTIIPCPACHSKQKRLDLEPKYMHWGEMIDGVLDERGEVGLISRNIRIHGVMEKTCPHVNANCDTVPYDTFGAHIRVTEGFANVHIEGVQLVNVGQQTDKSRYPIHFHMCFDVRNYTSPPYIRSNSIYNSFARCFTLHGTSGVTEGGEKWNTIDGNLLVGSMIGYHIPSDGTPAAYWITNPLNVIVNNVAAGGEGNGFWFLFPEEPIGLSKGLGMMGPGEASHTAVLEFDNNVMHSFAERGLVFDNTLELGGAASGINDYQPRRHPLVENSEAVEVVFSRITAFKNMHSNAWIRGGAIRVTQSSFADSVECLLFASSNSMVQRVCDTVFVGETDNVGEPFHKEVAGTEYHLNRSLPLPYAPQMPRTGFLFYDGPVFVENVWFNNFTHNSLYKMGAIGFNRNNEFGNSAVSSVKNVLFGFNDSLSDGNRVFFGDSTDYGYDDLDGNLVSTFRNYDGTMWGLPFTQTLKPLPFHLTTGCFIRPNAKMAFCTEKYGKVLFNIIKGNTKTKIIGVRDDVPSATVTQDGENACEFLTALGGRYSYTFHFMDMVPTEFEISGLGVEKNQWVRFGICLPRNAQFELSSWTPYWLPVLANWTVVNSVEELENLTKDGRKYHFNSETGMLYMKLMSTESRPSYHYEDCFGFCPRVTITILSGNRSDTDCRSRIYSTEDLNSETDVNRYPHSVATIPASSPRPPSGWGAGRTRPFHSRRVVSGEYGPWSNWSPCSVSCGGGIQTRVRQCIFASPENGGYICDGQSEEHRPCNNDQCVVDGGFSDWSSWTNCMTTGSCQGLQSRKRFCVNPIPQGGGKYCNGAVDEVKPCSLCSPFTNTASDGYGLNPYDRQSAESESVANDAKSPADHNEQNNVYEGGKLASSSEDVLSYDNAIDNAGGYI